MIILGIDPGLSITGYGVIELTGNSYRALDYGGIRSKKNESFPLRLKRIYDGISKIVKEWRPDSSAIEDIFCGENAKTALTIGHVRGVAILSVINEGIDVSEYPTRKIKQAVVGSGSASKEQVQFMVKVILNLSENPTPIDASDALAVAICHSRYYENI